MWTVVTAALVVLFPGLLAWWWGRGLIRLARDAALPERLLAYHTRRAELTIVAALFLIMVTGDQAWWAVPSMLVAALAGGHPVRYETR